MSWLYPAFLVVSILELLFEVRISARNSAALLKEGAKEVSPRTLPAMTALYIVMYGAGAIEHYAAQRNVSFAWFVALLALYIGAKALKAWAVTSLGRYWTMKVLIVPGTQVVTSGPYRWIRHPNYISVILEIAATCLIGKSYWTCCAVLALFCGVLYDRIRSEEKGLAGFTDYSKSMAGKRRFLP